MKRYEKYKLSGVEWIGEIPEHWDVKRLKYLAMLRDELIDNADFKIAVEHIESASGKLIKMDDEKRYEGTLSKFINGDTIFNKLRPYLHKVYYAERDGGLFGELLIVFSKGELLPKFLFYKLFAKPFIDVVDSSTYGTKMPRANWDNFISQLMICYPQDDDEQTTIAAYLDEKTAQIDALIEKKQKLIELLKEERTAIINHAVTKGVDPKVKLKPSGIEWLGDIPEHWEVKKLKYVISGKLKYGANEPAEFEEQNQPRYIRITDFGDDGKLRDDTFKSLPFDLAKEYLLKEGDLLFARSGATVGKAFQFKNYNGVACFAGYLIKASPDESQILSDFLYSFTKSGAYENWKNGIFNQATIQNIGADKYSILEVPVPPIEEQKGIIAYIETLIKKIDTAISKINKEINLLQEYRTALISEAVTGKIKVA